MLSYRYFITKLTIMLGGRALKKLLLGIVDAESQDQMVRTAKNSRHGLDNMRYWFRRNRQVAPPKEIDVAGVRVFTYAADKGNTSGVPVILFHGGGFIVGSHQSHGAFASELAAATGSMVYLVEYPLFPEVAIQEMIQACEAVVHNLVDKKNRNRFVLYGDSVGGFLACQVIAARIQQRLRLPDRLYLLSPLIQHRFSFDAEAVKSKIKTDDILGPTYDLVMENDAVRKKALKKLGCDTVTELLDLTSETVAKFPPVHITYDRDEVLAWEIQSWIKKLKAEKVSLVDNSVDNGFHAFAVYNYLAISKNYYLTLSNDFKVHIRKKNRS